MEKQQNWEDLARSGVLRTYNPKYVGSISTSSQRWASMDFFEYEYQPLKYEYEYFEYFAHLCLFIKPIVRFIMLCYSLMFYAFCGYTKMVRPRKYWLMIHVIFTYCFVLFDSAFVVIALLILCVLSTMSF